MIRSALGLALALAIAAMAPAVGLRAQDGGASVDTPDRAARADRSAAPGATPPGEVAAPEGLANQRGVIRHQAQEYRNLWYPNLESPPRDALTAGDGDTEERLGTSTRSLVDERPLWRMLSQEEYQQARTWLEKFQAWHPDWTPSDKLLTVLRKGELLAEIQQARDAGDWAALQDLADRHPEQFTCETVFNLWALAEARAALQGDPAALGVYTDILATCPRPVDRLVTLQRAAATIGYPMTWPLVQREAARSLDGAPAAAFERFRAEFYAAWLSGVVDRGEPAAGRVPARELAPLVRAARDAEAARLLGWYAMARRAYPDARRWFTRAQDWERSPDGAYGLALAWLRDGRRADAMRVARAWQGTDPRFDALLVEIAGLRARRAFEAQNYTTALSYAEADLARYARDADTPAARELQRIRAWSLFNLDRSQAALTAFAALYARAPEDRELAAALVYAAIAAQAFEPAQDLARQHGGPLAALVVDDTTDPSLDGQARDLRHLFHTAWFGAADGAADAAIARAEPVHDLIVTRQDADTAVPLGWAYLDVQRPEAAEVWFRRALAWTDEADAAVGLVEALRARQRDRAAEVVARRWADRSPILAEAARDLTLTRADAAYAEQDYERVLDLVGEARDLAGPSRRGRMLAAWSHYQQGSAGQAADLFEALYRAQPDAASAEGLFFAGRAAGRDARLAELAGQIDGPLAAHWRTHLSQRYLDLDLYAEAARTAQGTDRRVAGADAGHFTVHSYTRNRDGETAEGQLDLRGVQITGSIWHRRHRFGAGLAIERLDAGAPDDQTNLGTADGPGQASSAETEETVLLPTVSYGYSWPDLRGATLLDVTLGLTPLSGAVDPRPIGSISVERREVDRRARVELFSEPRTDSLLAYAGLDDPNGNAAFGRVVETGVRLAGAHRIRGPWSVDGRLQLSTLDGKHVDDNDRIALGAGVSYELGLEGFDYASIGPRYAFERYNENLSAFTLGHGGYFSPKSLHRVSLGAAFQTDDGADFVLRGAGGVGWQVTREDATVQLRRSSSGARIDGGRNSGLALDAQLDGGYRVTDRVTLGFRSHAIVNQDFQELGLGVFLRLSLDGRGGVLAGDIPDLPLR